MTEKLFLPFLYGAVPVYYGAPDVPQLTKTPSFIRVSDFKNRQELADYLIYLDSNETASMQYHQWRTLGYEAFSTEFLQFSRAQRIDSQSHYYNTVQHHNALRKQQCGVNSATENG